jgi:hypothetical protein
MELSDGSTSANIEHQMWLWQARRVHQLSLQLQTTPAASTAVGLVKTAAQQQAVQLPVCWITPAFLHWAKPASALTRAFCAYWAASTVQFKVPAQTSAIITNGMAQTYNSATATNRSNARTACAATVTAAPTCSSSRLQLLFPYVDIMFCGCTAALIQAGGACTNPACHRLRT